MKLTQNISNACFDLACLIAKAKYNGNLNKDLVKGAIKQYRDIIEGVYIFGETGDVEGTQTAKIDDIIFELTGVVYEDLVKGLT